MKNYDEMANDVLRRIGEYEIACKRKRRVYTKAITSLCCVCLAALMGVGMWQGGVFHTAPPDSLEDSAYKGEKESENEAVSNIANPDDKVVTDGTDKLLFSVNEITTTMNAAFKYLDPALHYQETWSSADMTEYLGVDLRNAISALPSGMEMKYEGAGEFSVTYQNDGTLVVDSAAYEFSGKDDKKVTILASRLGMPYDCLYQSESDNTTSIRIHDSGETISVLVYAQNKSESTMDYELYVADFEYNGVFYRVIAKNITAYQLDSIIREIAK